MKIAYANGPDWHKDHPMGTLVFQYLLVGEPGTPDNFMLLLARQEADFTMQRHRHNFDQIRFPLCGDMNIGNGIVLKQGQMGYFPEGVPYGPQEDPLGSARPGERLQLALQFGGASGCGFMSMAQRKAAWAELAKVGHFEGPIYHRPDGRKQWGLNAVWEQVFGQRLKYAMPRYSEVVIADPARFNALPVEGARNVRSRWLGAFSERRVWTETLSFGRQGRAEFGDAEARLLFFVVSGAGQVDGRETGRHAAIEVAPGERATFTSAEGMELFLIGLPPVVLPAESTEVFEEVDGMVVAGETP